MQTLATAWASAYKLWLRRRAQYQATIRSLEADVGPFAKLVEKTLRREPIPAYPDDSTLAPTDPHHKHVPPDIKHHRIPAPGLSLNAPNLPFLLQELASL